MKVIFILSFFYLIFSAPAHSDNFLVTDAYWEGKNAYMKGDYKGAFEAWINPAEKGDPIAQSFVAGLYHAGQGVKQDYRKALGLYQSSAEKGFSPAQLGMGNMIADGLGTEKDYIRAYMWFSIAAANGNPRAQYNLRKITDRMREDEIVLGEKMANDWLKKHPQKL